MAFALQVGAACLDITPPLSIPYLGFWPRHQPFQGVHDPLYARALAIRDAHATVVLLSVDTIGFSNDLLGPDRHFITEARRRIQEDTGVPGEHVMLTATHAHSTPETLHLRRLLDTPGADAWLETLLTRFATVARQAMACLAPCAVKIGATDIAGVARNRRVVGTDGRLYQWDADIPPPDRVADWGAVDQQATVLVFQRETTEGCALLAHFACHPVTMQAQPLVSADYPGLLTATLERALPDCRYALFLQGACGDINPVRATGSYADVEHYSRMLGASLIPLARELLTSETAVSPCPVVVKSAVITLPPGDIPDGARAARDRDAARDALDCAATADETAQAQAAYLRADEQVTRHARRAAPLQAEIQVMRLGNVVLVGIPGEPFVEIGLEIKRRAPAPWTMVVGYANGYLGYLPTSRAYAQGGYEVTPASWSLVGSAAASLIIETALALITEVMAR